VNSESELKCESRSNNGKSKRPGRASYAAQRELVELAKKLDLAGIVKKTGSKPEAILKQVRRLGLSIRGRK
jgi:hypothetical protein